MSEREKISIKDLAEEIKHLSTEERAGLIQSTIAVLMASVTVEFPQHPVLILQVVIEDEETYYICGPPKSGKDFDQIKKEAQTNG